VVDERDHAIVGRQQTFLGTLFVLRRDYPSFLKVDLRTGDVAIWAPQPQLLSARLLLLRSATRELLLGPVASLSRSSKGSSETLENVDGWAPLPAVAAPLSKPAAAAGSRMRNEPGGLAGGENLFGVSRGGQVGKLPHWRKN
jgi:hypothetical protein